MQDPRRIRGLRAPAAWLAVPALLLALAACGNDEGEPDGTRGADADAAASALPAPEGAVGSVTGMPASPGPGTAPLSRGVDPASSDLANAIEGDVGGGGATPVEGVFVLDDAPPLPGPTGQAAPAAPATDAPGSGATFVQPADGATRMPPAGTEAATETTMIVVPVEPAD